MTTNKCNVCFIYKTCITYPCCTTFNICEECLANWTNSCPSCRKRVKIKKDFKINVTNNIDWIEVMTYLCFILYLTVSLITVYVIKERKNKCLNQSYIANLYSGTCYMETTDAVVFVIVNIIIILDCLDFLHKNVVQKSNKKIINKEKFLILQTHSLGMSLIYLCQEYFYEFNNNYKVNYNVSIYNYWSFHLIGVPIMIMIAKEIHILVKWMYKYTSHIVYKTQSTTDTTIEITVIE